jgi:hypothetical protein
MPLRLPAIIEIPDEAIAELVGHIEVSSEAQAELQAAGVTPSATTSSGVELPTSWTFVEERQGETWTWGDQRETYAPFRVFRGATAGGTVRLALGECKRTEVRGRNRRYIITFFIRPTGSKRPISEFLETDDYEERGDLIAVIKGSDGGARMYDPTDSLPGVYQGFRIETYRDRIDYPGSFHKLGVVAHQDDVATMLGHTLIQAQSRFGLGPS